MKKIGFMINQINQSQQYTALSKNINTLCEKYKDIDPIVFYNDNFNTDPNSQFAIIQMVESLDYDGILIATDTISAHILKKCMVSKKKYFYIWNIDWHISNRPFGFIKDIYLNNEIELIARSQDHFKLIKSVFKEPKHIIEEFSYEQIRNIINDSQ